jgi:hypothetical protein
VFVLEQLAGRLDKRLVPVGMIAAFAACFSALQHQVRSRTRSPSATARISESRNPFHESRGADYPRSEEAHHLPCATAGYRASGARPDSCCLPRLSHGWTQARSHDGSASMGHSRRSGHAALNPAPLPRSRSSTGRPLPVSSLRTRSSAGTGSRSPRTIPEGLQRRRLCFRGIHLPWRSRREASQSPPTIRAGRLFPEGCCPGLE